MASILNVDQINNAAGTSAVTIDPSTGHATFPNGMTLPAGSVVQVVQTVFDGTFSTAIGPNFAEVTGLRCNITPTSASNKILVKLNLSWSTTYYQFRGRLLRNGATVSGSLGAQAGIRTPVTFNYIHYGGGGNVYDMWSGGFEYLDTPSTTSSTQYSVDIGGYNTSYTVFVNRNSNYGNLTDYMGTPISTLTLMEIAQ